MTIVSVRVGLRDQAWSSTVSQKAMALNVCQVSFLAGRVYLEELGNDSPHPGPAKVGWGARQMGRSSGHPRHSSIPLPSWLCHPGLNQTLPISQPPLRTRPLHTLPHSGLSHPITGPFQTPPFHSSSQQSEASDPQSSLGGCREGAGQRLGPHLFLATSVPRAQSEVTVIASFLDLSNSPSAFGHLHPKSRTTTRETTARGQGGGSPAPGTEEALPIRRAWKTSPQKMGQ